MNPLRDITMTMIGTLLSPLILLGFLAYLIVCGIKAGWADGERLLDWAAD